MIYLNFYFIKVLILTFLIYSCFNKSRNHAIYSIFDHFLFFNILASLNATLNSLIYLDLFSPISHKICTIDMLMSEFAVASQSVLLFLAGLILLAERATVTQSRSIFSKCGFLYADSDRATLEGVNEKTLVNCLTRNGRSLILLAGYLCAFLISAIFRHWYPNSVACESNIEHMGVLNQMLSLIFAMVVFILYYSTLVYYFVSGSTCLLHLTEMLQNRLEQKDLERISLAKKLTILNCLHGVCLFGIAFISKLLFLNPPNWLSLLGYFVDVTSIFITIIVFYYHESLVNKIRYI